MYMDMDRKNMLKVNVTTRFGAYNYCKQNNNVPCVIISISTPNTKYDYGPFISATNNVKDILPLAFVDKDSGPNIITDTKGFDIAYFVANYISTPYQINHILVHCDAGTSRSSGVAGAILKWGTGDDSQIFKNPRYIPNMRVYRTVLKCLIELEVNGGNNESQ